MTELDTASLFAPPHQRSVHTVYGARRQMDSAGRSKSANVHVAILQKATDTRARVGLADLGGLLGVEPDC